MDDGMGFSSNLPPLSVPALLAREHGPGSRVDRVVIPWLGEFRRRSMKY